MPNQVKNPEGTHFIMDKKKLIDGWIEIIDLMRNEGRTNFVSVRELDNIKIKYGINRNDLFKEKEGMSSVEN